MRCTADWNCRHEQLNRWSMSIPTMSWPVQELRPARAPHRWIATDTAFMQRFAQLRDYTTMCNWPE